MAIKHFGEMESKHVRQMNLLSNQAHQILISMHD